MHFKTEHQPGRFGHTLPAPGYQQGGQNLNSEPPLLKSLDCEEEARSSSTAPSKGPSSVELGALSNRSFQMGNRTDHGLMEEDLMMRHNSNCAYESSKKLMLDTEEGLTSEDPFPKQAWLDSSAIESGKAAFQEESIGLPGVHCSRCGSFVKASDSPLLKGVAPVLLYTHCGKEAHRRLCAPCVLETYECPFCPTQDDGEQNYKEEQMNPQPESTFVLRVFSPSGVSPQKRRAQEGRCLAAMQAIQLQQKMLIERRKEKKRRQERRRLLKIDAFLIFLPSILLGLALLGLFLSEVASSQCSSWGGFQECNYSGGHLRGYDILCCPHLPSGSCPADSTICIERTQFLRQNSLRGSVELSFCFTLAALCLWICGGAWMRRQLRLGLDGVSKIERKDVDCRSPVLLMD